MSVTFLDPTLPARIPSRYEVIDARVTTPLSELTISLRLPNGKWDVIFQDGLLGLDYNATTVTPNGVDDNTFHISRAGGWPANQRLEFRFKEPSSDADTFGWEVVYEKDLRTLANQSISSANEYKDFTLDGRPWASHIGGGGSVALVSGQGLRLTADPGSHKRAGSPYAGTCVFINTNGWPGLNLSQEICVAFRFGGATPTDDFTSPSEGGAASYSGPHIWGLGGNGANIYIVRLLFGANFAGGVAQTPNLYFNLSSLLPLRITAAHNTNNLDTWSWAVSACPYDSTPDRHPKANLRSAWWNKEVPSPGGHVSPNTMIPLTLHNGVDTGEASPWLLGAYHGNRNIGVPRSVYVTHIRVMQRPLS